MVIITVVLIAIVACTFVGNLFVIIAILIDKNLQTPANQLVLSLAVADLMVGCLVMPLGTYNDISQGWWLGKEVCEFWTSADVLCCTASILNLLAIALDRYWAVTNVDYIYRRTRRRVSLMILCAWTVGAVVSLAPIFGWKDPDFARRVLEDHKCLVSQDVAYQIFATISTFYAPLVLLLALYWRIFKVARKRIHCKPGRKSEAASQQQHKGAVSTTSNLITKGVAEQKGQRLSAVAPLPRSAAVLWAALTEPKCERAAHQLPGNHKHYQPSKAHEALYPSATRLEHAQPDQKSIAQRGAPAASETLELARCPLDTEEAKCVSSCEPRTGGPSASEALPPQPSPLSDQDGSNFKPFCGATTTAGPIVARAADSTQSSAKLTTLTTNDIFTKSGRGQLATSRKLADARHQQDSDEAKQGDARRLKGAAGARFVSRPAASTSTDDFAGDDVANSEADGRQEKAADERQRLPGGTAARMNEKQICLRPSQAAAAINSTFKLMAGKELHSTAAHSSSCNNDNNHEYVCSQERDQLLCSSSAKRPSLGMHPKDKTLVAPGRTATTATQEPDARLSGEIGVGVESAKTPVGFDDPTQKLARGTPLRDARRPCSVASLTMQPVSSRPGQQLGLDLGHAGSEAASGDHPAPSATDAESGRHHQFCSSPLMCKIYKRPSLVQLDVQMLSTCLSNNINNNSPTNSLSECHCCCCPNTMERTSDGGTSEEDEEDCEDEEEGEEDDEDDDEDKHETGSGGANRNELRDHHQHQRPCRRQDASGNNPSGAQFVRPIRPWRASKFSRNASGGGGGRICDGNRGELVAWQSDKISLHQFDNKNECTCKQSTALGQMVLAHRELLSSQSFKEAQPQVLVGAPGDSRHHQTATRATGVLPSMSSSSSATSLVSSSSSSRSMLAAAAAAELDYPNDQMIEQFHIDNEKEEQRRKQQGEEASCYDESQQQLTTFNDSKARFWWPAECGRVNEPNTMLQTDVSRVSRIGTSLGDEPRAATLAIKSETPNQSNANKGACSSLLSSLCKECNQGDRSLVVLTGDNGGTGASQLVEGDRAVVFCWRQVEEPISERKSRGQAQRSLGSNKQQQQDGEEEKEEDEEEEMKKDEKGKERGKQTLVQGTASRSSGIRRRFRALGQLVSFVQTSRQFNSFSSTPSSQSGDEHSGGSPRHLGSGASSALLNHEEEMPCGRATTTATTTTSIMNQTKAAANATLSDESQGRAASEHRTAAVGSADRVRKSGKLDNNSDGLFPSGGGHQQGDCGKLASTAAAGQDNQLNKGQNTCVAASASASATGSSTVALLKATPLKRVAGGTSASADSVTGQRQRDPTSAQQRRQNLEMKREKKAAKALAIITGVFVCCWLPFFLNAIVMPICGPACTPSDLILSVLLWLGYLNSLLNPIIYTIFSPDFRRAFHRLLCWRETSRSSFMYASAKGRGAGGCNLSAKYGKRRRRTTTATGSTRQASADNQHARATLNELA